MTTEYIVASAAICLVILSVSLNARTRRFSTGLTCKTSWFTIGFRIKAERDRPRRSEPGRDHAGEIRDLEFSQPGESIAVRIPGTTNPSEDSTDSGMLGPRVSLE
jgi:hypothetical protein